MAEFRQNTDDGKFELIVNGHIAYADYRQDGRMLYIDYVFAPPTLRGQGVASDLLSRILDFSNTHGLKLYPVCKYASAWMKKQKKKDAS